MPRLPRIVEPNGVYHVFSRGNNKEQIFWDDRDYQTFLMFLGQVASRYGWIVLAYCLMPNHVHLLVRVPAANLSQGMQFLNGAYSRTTNKRRGRVRHLFQNRFGSVHVQTDAHLLGEFRYVALNPVEAGLCRRPEEWRWSSYRATAGFSPPPPFLAVREALAFFGKTSDAARISFREFVCHEPVTESDTGTRL